MPGAALFLGLGRRLMPLAATALVIVVSHLAVTATFSWFRIPGVAGSIWWPAAGIVLAIVIRCPRSWWPLLLAGFGFVTAMANRPDSTWQLTVAYVIANVFEVGVAGLLLVDRRTGDVRLHTPREGIRFFLVLAATVAAGAFIVTVACWLFPQPRAWYSIASGYARTHGLGLIAMAPLLLPRDFSWRRTRRPWESFFLFVVMIAVDVWVFWSVDAPSFVVLLPLVWAGVRFDVFQATAAALVTSALAAYGAARGAGPFAPYATPELRQIITQLLIGTVTAMTLILVLAARRRALLTARVADSEKTIRLMLRDSLVGTYVLRIDPDRLGEISDVNGAFCELVGYSPSELIGNDCRMLFPPMTSAQEDQAAAWLDDFATGPADTMRRETGFITQSGEQLWTEIVITRVRPVSGDPFVFIHVHDLTEREHAKAALEHLAWRDGLTGLPNRTLLFDRLDQQLRHGDRDGESVGLIYLDLDGFKPVNDEHGHDAGDEVLIETSRRLLASVRAEDTVARLGGDEFAILCARPAAISDVDSMAARIRAAMREPIELAKGSTVFVGVSVGTAMAGGEAGPARSAEELIRAADQAMYDEKRSHASASGARR